MLTNSSNNPPHPCWLLLCLYGGVFHPTHKYSGWLQVSYQFVCGFPLPSPFQAPMVWKAAGDNLIIHWLKKKWRFPFFIILALVLRSLCLVDPDFTHSPGKKRIQHKHPAIILIFLLFSVKTTPSVWMRSPSLEPAGKSPAGFRRERTQGRTHGVCPLRRRHRIFGECHWANGAWAESWSVCCVGALVGWILLGSWWSLVLLLFCSWFMEIRGWEVLLPLRCV